MSESRVRNVVGVGLGPFNLGLAALLDDAPEDVDATFLGQDVEFAWHEGMLTGGTTLEVPFLVNLITLTDPTSPHSYLNYLRETGRVYKFYFYKTFQIPRREYNDYLRWVIDRLDACRFEHKVIKVRWDSHEERCVVTARNPNTSDRLEYRAENLALGVDSRPRVPKHPRGRPTEDVFHMARCRGSRERVGEADTITIVEFGQNVAEVFRDLLER